MCIQDLNGNTPLHYTLYYMEDCGCSYSIKKKEKYLLKIIKLFLKYGFDLNTENYNNETVADLIVHYGYLNKLKKYININELKLGKFTRSGQKY